MKSLLFTLACCASLVSSISLPLLRPRQANSAIAASAFRRRAYHCSILLDNRIYIDGGEFSYSGGSDVTYQYSSSLLSIDLSSDWTNSTVNIQSTSKPAGAPDLVSGGLWVDHARGVLYTGFAGRQSTFGDGAYQHTGLWSFKPDGTGSGTWKNLNSTADSALQTGPRPVHPLVASGGGAGYALGGFAVNTSSSDPRNDRIVLSGLITYNMTTQKITNSTVGISTKGIDQMGGLHYVGNFGSQGILVGYGGDQFGISQPGSDSLLSFAKVQIYDIGSQKWFTQTVTGNVPEARKEFCTTGVVSDNKTYEIFLYAGWDGNLGPKAVPYDEAYVLTLPGFHWVKADYAALNPRHGLTCNSVGGGQILTVGGLNTSQNGPDDLYKDVFNTADQFTQGLAVFDLNTLSWKSSFSASQKSYSPAPAVQSFYANNARTPAFDNIDLKSVFAVQSFNASTTGSGSASSSSSPSSSSGSSSSTGAIAGGVVGGILGLALIAGLVFMILRRKRAKKTSPHAPVHEVPGQEHQKHELDASHKYVPDSAYSTDKNGKYEAVPTHELAGSEGQRHELA